ncbi:MAG: membrane integrity-associated transporter subunit PqiC [Gammaproteobacteria bacterium]|nr:membrane integrity-associated transporter subunit PqiC [Gammaproteobacteria bacterium]
MTDADLAGVRLLSLRAASWLNGGQIPYRQLHQRPEAVNHYAAHAWIAPPSEMLRARLEQMLAADGNARERWRLEVELLSFEQVFTSARDAQATILLRASLRERGGDDRIHQRSFSATTPVSADVDGAIEGLPKVADTALRDLVAWVADVTTSSR